MKYDVIIVLAGGIQDDGSLAVSVKKRIEKARLLFFHKKAPRILMTGKWSIGRTTPVMTEARAMYNYARKIGIPKKAIYLEEKSNNTLTNIRFTMKYFLIPNKWKKIIIVTSDFHMYRTRLICMHVFGTSYNVMYVTAKTNASSFRKLQWYIKDFLSALFFQIRFSFSKV